MVCVFFIFTFLIRNLLWFTFFIVNNKICYFNFISFKTARDRLCSFVFNVSSIRVICESRSKYIETSGDELAGDSGCMTVLCKLKSWIFVIHLFKSSSSSSSSSLSSSRQYLNVGNSLGSALAVSFSFLPSPGIARPALDIIYLFIASFVCPVVYWFLRALRMPTGLSFPVLMTIRVTCTPLVHVFLLWPLAFSVICIHLQFASYDLYFICYMGIWHVFALSRVSPFHKCLLSACPSLTCTREGR